MVQRKQQKKEASGLLTYFNLRELQKNPIDKIVVLVIVFQGAISTYFKQ
jgi:hypothetical protein